MTRRWDEIGTPDGSSDRRGEPTAPHRGPHDSMPTALRGRTARALGIAAVAVLLLNALIAGAFLGAGAMPFQFAAGSEDDTASPPTTVSASESLAAQTVAATIATEVPTFTATSEVSLGGGGVTAFPCDLEIPTQPVLGSSRFYNIGDRTVSATVSAYPTGTGPWVIESAAASLAACAQARPDVKAPVGLDGVGVQAVIAELPSGSVALVRRGDVMMQIAGPGAETRAVASALDEALSANLSACLDPVGRLGDERRNPWLADVPYEGLLTDSEVTVAAIGPPEPPSGVAAVPLTQQPVDLPQVNRPERPAEPVWPAQLPVTMPAPVAPPNPGPEPVSSVIKVPVPDRLGPGCGWAFTATTAPAVDEDELAERTAALRESARVNLLAAQQAWRPQVVTFYEQWDAYLKKVTGFQQYAVSVAIVAKAWDKINNDRQVYFDALARWEAAVAVRDSFLAAQAQARTDYDAAVVVCSQPEPTPTPSPTTTAPAPSPTPSPPRPTARTAAASAVGASAGNPILRYGRAPAVRPGCPPQRPAILDQAPPYVPPKPAPPADPRPPQFRR